MTGRCRSTICSISTAAGMPGSSSTSLRCFFTRGLWLKAGARVSESLYFSMDYELWLRFAEQGGRLHVLGRPLAWFRLHDGQKTADEAAFKVELATVRSEYLARTGYQPPPPRQAPDHGRRLRIALVNDIGWQYGAGIAQHRLAEAIESAGHTTISIALTAVAVPPGEPAAGHDGRTRRAHCREPGRSRDLRQYPWRPASNPPRWPRFLRAGRVWS
ncbi:MAG: hypothetical protein WDN69_36000 [Aliidongia sp.]